MLTLNFDYMLLMSNHYPHKKLLLLPARLHVVLLWLYFCCRSKYLDVSLPKQMSSRFYRHLYQSASRDIHVSRKRRSYAIKSILLYEHSSRLCSVLFYMGPEHCTTVLYLGRFVVGSKDLPKAILCLLVFYSIP